VEAEAYHNAYLLLIGATTYDELAEQEVFFLPENHEDPRVVLSYYESIKDYEKLLRYYESIEDYEKCNRIIKST
jgi:hypothetical protein